MLKLKLQSFGYLMLRTDSSEKTLILGKIEVRRVEKQKYFDNREQSKDEKNDILKKV